MLCLPDDEVATLANNAFKGRSVIKNDERVKGRVYKVRLNGTGLEFEILYGDQIRTVYEKDFGNYNVTS